ncbi:tetratricopeptide repeat protein [Streptomyces sp. NPDC057638]|uniref:tetratricopeptide repeat protein n=1 Tax=Streptomyces sp. NPDC057638 TaxID=3346190 RepID=UPI0036B041F4
MFGGTGGKWSARKAEQAWLRGMDLLRTGDTDGAAERFDAAVDHDPTAADAWLGLHAVGEARDEALESMAREQRSFGALRRKFQRPLLSRFSIGAYASFRLESSRDLWLAVVARRLDEGRLDEAGMSLSTAVLDCDETRFTWARYSFLRQDWPRVLTVAEGIGDRFLRDEAQLYVAKALVVQEVFHEALDVLTPLPRVLGNDPRFLGELAHQQGLALEGVGRSDEALRSFQRAFRYYPQLAGVAERAGVRPPEGGDEPPSEPSEPSASGAPGGSGTPGEPGGA